MVFDEVEGEVIALLLLVESPSEGVARWSCERTDTHAHELRENELICEESDPIDDGLWEGETDHMLAAIRDPHQSLD